MPPTQVCVFYWMKYATSSVIKRRRWNKFWSLPKQVEVTVSEAISLPVTCVNLLLTWGSLNIFSSSKMDLGGGENKNKQKTAENPQTNFHGIQRRVLRSPAVQEQTFYFIMQTATYELYYLPKGAGKRSYTRGKINHTVCVKSKSNTHISLSHKGKIHPKNNMYIPLMSDSSFLLCGFNWVSPNSRNMGSRTFTFLCRHHRRKTWLYIKVSGLWKDRWSISVLTCTQIWSELCIIVIKWILQGFCFTKAFYQSFSTHKYSSGENWTFN